MGPLLESLLAERFQLTFHREKRELPVYALVTARSSELQWTPDQLPPRAPGTPADQPIRVNGVDIDPNGRRSSPRSRNSSGSSWTPRAGRWR